MRHRALPLLVPPVVAAALVGCGGGSSRALPSSASSAAATPSAATAATTAAAPATTQAPSSAAAPTSGPTTADPLGLGALSSVGAGLPGGGGTGVPGGGAARGGLPQPSAALPASFPPGFPVPAEARVTGASDSGGHGHVQLTVRDTRASYAQLRQALPPAGYAVSAVSPLADTGAFVSGHFAFSGRGVRGTVDAQGGAPGFLTVDYTH